MKTLLVSALVLLVNALDKDNLKTEALSVELLQFMTKIRRDLHKQPELSFEEVKTSAYLQERLKELGIPFTVGWGKNKQTGAPGGTGIVAHIGNGSSPCVALRTDIDALAILEEVESEFKSEIPGKMHACGHDSHMAMLLGAAKLLKSRESEINGTVRLIFQPAEEGGAGGLMMVEEGVLDLAPRVDRIFGLHQMPYLPGGEIFGRAGGIMAGSDFFWGEFVCNGGHGAMPHLSNDPLMPLTNYIQMSQTIVSRNINPLESGVVSFTKVEAADQMNVISQRAKFGGTFRSFTQNGMDLIKNRLKQIGEGVAKSFNCDFSFESLKIPYIPTINDSEAWEQVKEDLGFAAIDGKVKETDPIMPAEDFAFYLRERPGAFLFLGTGSEDTSFPLHNSKFKLLESAMPHGALLLSATAITQLERLNKCAKEERV
eukprot:GDKJ01055591.1.p1 GENE.GDKJ01055591.1~~GDKJ01055591.1.p1  ORF type:complete len:436 (-),score=111.34 GDKJ01055591.1:65-1351(-)